MISRFYLTLLLVFICSSSFALNNGSNAMTGKSLEGLAKIKNKTLYFGHQSVGYNIVDGIADVLSENNVAGYRIVDISGNAGLLRGTGFFHSTIGKNGDPYLKITEFKKFIEMYHENIDVAFFKFCYIDITHELDINDLFNHYKETMDALIKGYPAVTFVHFTAPLRVVQTGPKAWVKKLLNKPLGGAVDNVQRNRLNQKIIQQYSMTSPVFDLATAESTLADGQVNQFDYQGKQYRTLISEYTDDGKHLNAVGRKIIARDLLAFFGSQSF